MLKVFQSMVAWFCLYLSCLLCLSAVASSELSQEPLASEPAFYEESWHNLDPLAQMPLLSMSCALVYREERDIKSCQRIAIYLTQLRIMEGNYQTSRDKYFWHHAINWLALLVVAKADNTAFDRMRFPKLKNTLEFAIILQSIGMYADTGARLLDFQLQNVNKDLYYITKGFFESVGTGIVIGTLLIFKPDVAIGYKLGVPVIVSSLVMTFSFIAREAKVDLNIIAVAGALAGALAGAGAVAVAGAVAIAGAEAGAGMVALAEVGALALAEAEAGALAGVVTVFVVGIGAGGLLVWAITKIAEHPFSVMENHVSNNLLRLGLLCVVLEINVLTSQITSDFNSGATLSGSCAKRIMDFCHELNDNFGNYVLFWGGSWILLKIKLHLINQGPFFNP